VTENIYTPSRLNNEVKIILENNYSGLWLTGEISGYKLHSGNAYFKIKDAHAQVNAVMWKSTADVLKFAPQDGAQVNIFGRLSAYPKRGDYQIVVSRMEPSGEGELYKQFELLKTKLSEEGIFDAEHKRPLPKVISKVGIITSKDGAALHDILAVFKKSAANFETIIYPVQVQGEKAKFEIAEAIEHLNADYPDIDVLLIGRGGGSIEDLWAFNEEIVVRAIYNSKIVAISCVGHETDNTLADFAADHRAPTPTYAAEMVAQINESVQIKLDGAYKTLLYEISRKTEFLSQKLNIFARALKKPHLIYENKLTYVDDLSRRMLSAINNLCKLQEIKLENKANALNMVSPLNVLKRGYSIASFNGAVVKSKSRLKKADIIEIIFSDGKVSAEVK